ncbi:Na+/H+ antiporter NhaC family protein [Vibrio rhodolitus]|uniref:Na+/H+ antiporter NhaC family protein n=1 Tax=Vibrio rhodolitus TaxID=2231649 RepID=UPI000E0A4225|nr:Na+/H+ antiporter NhaC family protein [Vibrio rhodolitus]
MSEQIQQPKLEFYVGKIGGIIPLFLMISMMLLLTAYGMGGPKGAWAPGFFAILVGLVLVKNKGDYCRSILDGIANKTGVVVITAWIFAAVLGALMKAGGLVDGILWFGLSTGIEGSAFLVIVFASNALFASGTGSSNGANLALAPILFPAAVALGADPVWAALALLSGAVFGDNVAPISDVTIVGCTTQGADLGQTVKERFPLAITAGTMALIALVTFGGSGESIQAANQVDVSTLSPVNLFMLLAVAAVVITALKGRHLIEALSYGIITAMVVGLALGQFAVSDLFHIPSVRGESNGIIENAMAGVTGAVMFVLVLLGIIRIFMDSGLMDTILQMISRNLGNSRIKSELTIFFSTAASSLLVSSNAPSQLLVGPTIVRPIGEAQDISPERRSNLMSAAVCSIFYMMPWCLAVMVWYSAIETAAITSNIPVPSAAISFIAPYPWALFIVFMFSIFTGWKRGTTKDKQPVEKVAQPTAAA